MTAYGDPVHVTVMAVCPATVCWGLTYPILPPSTFNAGVPVTIKANITKLTNAGFVPCAGERAGLYIDGTKVTDVVITANSSGGEVIFTFSISTAGAHKVVVSVEGVVCDPNGPCYTDTVPGCGTDMWCETCGPGYCTLPTW